MSSRLVGRLAAAAAVALPAPSSRARASWCASLVSFSRNRHGAARRAPAGHALEPRPRAPFRTPPFSVAAMASAGAGGDVPGVPVPAEDATTTLLVITSPEHRGGGIPRSG